MRRESSPARAAPSTSVVSAADIEALPGERDEQVLEARALHA